MNFPLLIKLKRKLLKETQEEFGGRFGFGGACVANWEKGRREAPYVVLDFVLDGNKKIEVCDKCRGTGVIEFKITNCEKHKKVYAPHQLLSDPPQQQWICEECGKEGIDTIGKFSTNNYSIIKKKYNIKL